MPEALTHAVMPWAMAEGRMRQMLLFRFEPQHTGTLPPELPPEVLARLSDQTKELMAFAHISHTKEVAAVSRHDIAAIWVALFSQDVSEIVVDRGGETLSSHAMSRRHRARPRT